MNTAMYSQEHQIDYHGIDKKQRREDQAKRHGIIMYWVKYVYLAIIEAPAEQWHGWGYATEKSGCFRRYRPRKNNEKKRYFPW